MKLIMRTSRIADCNDQQLDFSLKWLYAYQYFALLPDAPIYASGPLGVKSDHFKAPLSMLHGKVAI